jgi:hypothetical protein
MCTNPPNPLHTTTLAWGTRALVKLLLPIRLRPPRKLDLIERLVHDIGQASLPSVFTDRLPTEEVD